MEDKADPESDSAAPSTASLLSTSQPSRESSGDIETIELQELPPAEVEYPQKLQFLRSLSPWMLFGVILTFVLGSFMLPWTTILEAFLVWIEEVGPYGVLILAGAFVLISFPFTFGYTPLALAAGFLYGAVEGLIAVTVGSTVGGALAFWACRKLVRRDTLNGIKSNKIGMVLFVMGESGWKGAIISRFIPFPYGLSNAILAMTSITFRSYIITTFLGLLPFQVMLTYFGTTLRSITDVLSGRTHFSWIQTAVLVAQVAIAAASVGYLVYLARRYQNQMSTMHAATQGQPVEVV
jgi:uncharacterized membrane protein YdjX (TVP38/TMEM64 family)